MNEDEMERLAEDHPPAQGQQVGYVRGAMNWEYTEVTDGTNALERWVLQLNAHGAVGWEVVGITATDPTIGLNCYTAILKRPVAPLPPPASTAAGWYPDPASRFEMRHWDGIRWTQHVSSGGVTDFDLPNVR